VPSNYALNQIVAPDPPNPTKASTLTVGVFVHHFNIDVLNQGIFWQLQSTPLPTDPPQMGTFQAYAFVYMPPGSRTILRPQVTGIRFYAAMAAASLPAGNQAIVTIEAVIM
jgi:hypothetical protein